ncbi:heterokaryon incompatibility protein-domain-containing protein [Paraphoma chrysanthemicola]|nr:heterokaryon incompatibility protein-domain-containing protein [Paraphoma chrysanthemicola]
MNTDLVLSRKCRHVDWCKIPDTSIEFCKRCGFAMIFSAKPAIKDAFKKVQGQPTASATFQAAGVSSLGGRSHRYTSIDLSHGRQVRVLVLRAGQSDDPLSCDLEHVNLQQGPIYEALSYTWADANGDDALSHSIQCGKDGELIAITRNCDEALRRLRKSNMDRRLWVDAICIDQSNIRERNHQVKNMIAIFRSAIRVLVYLGQEHHVLDRLIDYIGSDTTGQLPEVSDMILLFQSRWFHRVWILQEIAVAKSVLVTYGDKRMSWPDLIEQSKLFLRLMSSRDLALILPPVISYGLQQSSSSGRLEHGDMDLMSLLQISRSCSCKDARDKVYAVLGLLHNDSQLPLRADYSGSVTAGWVYLQAAAWYIDKSKSLKILSLIDGKSDLTMPSWVPDWTSESRVPLPAQFIALRTYRKPQICSIGRKGLYCVSPRRPLPLTGRAVYPLSSILRVLGRRHGTVWGDKLIFSDVPRPRRGPRIAILSGDDMPEGYAQDHAAHWLLDPVQNAMGSRCERRKDFWNQISTASSESTGDANISNASSRVRADIPPTFGGPCKICFRWGSTYGKEKGCCSCTSLGNRAGHFDNKSLNDFIAKIRQYGAGRKIFATDHSLGLGPEDIEDWDEVWELEGAEVAMILRWKNDEFRLVGACYIHRAAKVTDHCVTCAYETTRQSITVNAKNEQRGHGDTAIYPEIQANPFEFALTKSLSYEQEWIEIV